MNETPSDMQPTMRIERIYVKDISFESPKSPHVFQKNWQPEVNMEVRTKSEAVGQDLHEVVVEVKLTGKQDDGVVMIIEVEHAGLFTIKGLSDAQLQFALGASCPQIIFPYLRETVDGLCSRGTFPPFMMAPINFEQIFHHQQQQQKQN